MRKALLKFFLSIFNPQLFIPSALLIFAVYSSFLIYQVANEKPDNHLVLLAERFLLKKIGLSPFNLPPGDYVNYFGNIYLYFGPFPSMFLVPFVLVFGKDFPQAIIGLTSLVISFGAIYSVGRNFKFGEIDSLWLSIFFVFSTVLLSLGLINITAYQIQALGASLVLLSLAEYFGKKRPLLIGLYIAFAGLTRLSLYLSLLFYLLEGIRTRFTSRQWLYFFIPIIFSFLLLGTYNYKRFHSPFETGYRYNITLKTYPMSENAKFGLLNPIHIPANLYSFLLKGPEPLRDERGAFVLKFPYLKVEPWGLAIWYTSPLFIYLLVRPKRAKFTLAALVATLGLAVPSLLYFGIGFSQFGYRYALDFLPFLFILLLPSLTPILPWPAKILIILGVLFNSLYLTSLWEVYPHFSILAKFVPF